MQLGHPNLDVEDLAMEDTETKGEEDEGETREVSLTDLNLLYSTFISSEDSLALSSFELRNFLSEFLTSDSYFREVKKISRLNRQCSINGPQFTQSDIHKLKIKKQKLIHSDVLSRETEVLNSSFFGVKLLDWQYFFHGYLSSIFLGRIYESSVISSSSFFIVEKHFSLLRKFEDFSENYNLVHAEEKDQVSLGSFINKQSYYHILFDSYLDFLKKKVLYSICEKFIGFLISKKQKIPGSFRRSLLASRYLGSSKFFKKEIFEQKDREIGVQPRKARLKLDYLFQNYEAEFLRIQKQSLDRYYIESTAYLSSDKLMDICKIKPLYDISKLDTKDCNALADVVDSLNPELYYKQSYEKYYKYLTESGLNNNPVKVHFDLAFKNIMLKNIKDSSELIRERHEDLILTPESSEDLEEQTRSESRMLNSRFQFFDYRLVSYDEEEPILNLRTCKKVLMETRRLVAFYFNLNPSLNKMSPFIKERYIEYSISSYFSLIGLLTLNYFSPSFSHTRHCILNSNTVYNGKLTFHDTIVYLGDLIDFKLKDISTTDSILINSSLRCLNPINEVDYYVKSIGIYRDTFDLSHFELAYLSLQSLNIENLYLSR